MSALAVSLTRLTLLFFAVVFLGACAVMHLDVEGKAGKALTDKVQMNNTSLVVVVENQHNYASPDLNRFKKYLKQTLMESFQFYDIHFDERINDAAETSEKIIRMQIKIEIEEAGFIQRMWCGVSVGTLAILPCWATQRLKLSYRFNGGQEQYYEQRTRTIISIFALPFVYTFIREKPLSGLGAKSRAMAELIKTAISNHQQQIK